MKQTRKAQMYLSTTLLDHIKQHYLNNKKVLLVTSNPSIALNIQSHFPLLSLAQVTGANNHQFKEIVEKMKSKTIDVMVLGIEQLINPSKLSIIMEHFIDVDTIMIDQIHHLSKTNFDYRPEYENLSLLIKTYTNSDWLLFYSILDDTDVTNLRLTFDIKSTSIIHPNTSYTYVSYDGVDRLKYLVDHARKYKSVFITHHYLQAEIIANQINQFLACEVVHRKVEETKKVESIKKWQSGLLDHIVITSDTTLPHPFSKVDAVVFLEPPISEAQVTYFQQLYQSSLTLLVFNKDKFMYEDSALHQFPYDELLNDVIDCLTQNPTGLTMRQMEHTINVDSYQLEKAMKGLKAYNAIKKDKLVYMLDQPFYLTPKQIQLHHNVKYQAYDAFKNKLQPSYTHLMPVDEHIMTTFYHHPLTVRPKVLFPTGFFKQSLIKKEHRSEHGYVFAVDYPKIHERAIAIDKLIQKNYKNEQITVTSLSKENDKVSELALYLHNHFFYDYKRVFEQFDSSLLKVNLNPYHKMKAILEQLKIIHSSSYHDVLVIVADHGDHFWQMGVLAKILLEGNLIKKVVVIFNQP